MAGTLRWHSCSTNDFPLKRHKVSKACEACRGKKMKCDGKYPCQRCENNKTICKYNYDTKRSSATITTTTTTTTDNSCHFIPVKRLHKISFQQQSLPPLLLDFFNLTAQPRVVWSHFLDIFDKRTGILDPLLVKESFRLFVTHNLFYGPFIHTQLPLNTTEVETMMMTYCILALTFYAAAIHQAPSRELLYAYAIQSYKEAQKLFFETCFPAIPTSTTPNNKTQLIQASILLAHFQCQVFDKEQAYMTIRLGLDLAYHREDDNDDDNDDRLSMTLKVLEAWYCWLLFYLDKPLSMLDILQDDIKIKSPSWALDIMDGYTLFLKSILIKESHESLNTQSIKDSLGQLLELFSNDHDEYTNNQQIIFLYHQILTIQLFQCHFTTTNTIKEDNNALEICIEAAQNIVSTVQKILKEKDDGNTVTRAVRDSIRLVSQLVISFSTTENDAMTDLQTELDQFLKLSILHLEQQYNHNHDLLVFFKSIYQQTPLISPVTSSSSSSSELLLLHHQQQQQQQSNNKQHDFNTSPHHHDMIPSQDIFISSLPIKSFNNNATATAITLLDQQQQQMIPQQTAIVKSRGNIDQEQLDKLSRKLPLQQPTASSSSNYLFSITKHPNHEDVVPSNSNLQYYYYNKRPEQSFNMTPNKRIRTSNHAMATGYEDPMTVLSSSPRAHQPILPHNSHHSNSFINMNQTTTETPLQTSSNANTTTTTTTSTDDLMYWVLDEEPPFYSTQQPSLVVKQANRRPTSMSSHSSSSSSSASSSSDALFLLANNNVLPLPQPSKPSSSSYNSMMPLHKHDPHTWSKFFFASEVQTLHYQHQQQQQQQQHTTVPNSALDVIHEEVEPNESTRQAEAAAAAAAAVWASTVVALNPQAPYTTTNNSDNTTTTTTTTAYHHPATATKRENIMVDRKRRGHWINSERLLSTTTEDDEYW
ncbi:MAG: hypothetical protein EXX96DRAFT_650816 [Benjaminiella poitrasii]|nr:MAG: hypothetical protein EXX96DRAFT_650816 [Benjaminiella poitrasii]